ncbi:MAG: homoserine kinase [Neisseriaceae bacterium]|nr:homoserine kinase [Neisseriaceae bacterium]
MSVYTSVSRNELSAFLENYDLGELINYQGISGGITNTNYFVDTTKKRLVLTLFESLKQDEIPFFMNLKAHLNQHNVACPAPVPQKNGEYVGNLCGKPASLISCLNGKDVDNPNEKQCYATGAMLAKMHLATKDFGEQMHDTRGISWLEESAGKLSGRLSNTDNQLLQQYINSIQQLDSNLPNGVIHADLFRDNVLLYNDEVAGFIDFYYACNGIFVYDLAIALNDWARCDKTNTLDDKRYTAMLSGYESIRKLTIAEKNALQTAHCAAAMRFWVSRLLDFHFPTEGELTFIKNPDVFRDLLKYVSSTDFFYNTKG